MPTSHPGPQFPLLACVLAGCSGLGLEKALWKPYLSVVGNGHDKRRILRCPKFSCRLKNGRKEKNKWYLFIYVGAGHPTQVLSLQGKHSAMSCTELTSPLTFLFSLIDNFGLKQQRKEEKLPLSFAVPWRLAFKVHCSLLAKLTNQEATSTSPQRPSSHPMNLPILPMQPMQVPCKEFVTTLLKFLS
jgi:hypothetical protein